MATEDEVLVEERIVGDIRSGLTYTVSYSFVFGNNAEGVRIENRFIVIGTLRMTKNTSVVSNLVRPNYNLIRGGDSNMSQL